MATKKPAAPTGKGALTKNTTQAKTTEAAPAEFKLEDGVAIPSRQTAVNKYPFRDMAVGQSFRAPLEGVLNKEAATKLGRSIGSAASRFGKASGKKFTTRTMTEGKGFFVRCWRIDEEK